MASPSSNNTGIVTGLTPVQVTAKQIQALQAHVGRDVLLKADRVLGVPRETVKLLEINVQEGMATVEVPDWGTEYVPLYMFVKLY